MKSHLFSILVLLIIFSSAEGNGYDKGFVATFGKFDPMPTTLEQAKKEGWISDGNYDCYNGGKFYGYRVIEEDDHALALLYDKNHQIAGFQALIKEDCFDGSLYQYHAQPMYQYTNVNGEEYLVLTAYLIDPRKICSDTEPRDLNYGVVEYFYYQNGSTPSEENLVLVPNDRDDAAQMGWDNEGCFNQMGFHNIWHVRDFRDTDCHNFFPTLVLYDEYGSLSGAGFWNMCRGKTTSPRFEEPPGPVIKIIMGDDAPDCILERETTSFHMYFTQDPTNYKCPA